MENKNNIDLVRQAYEYFAKGNIQGVTDMMAEDVNWIIPKIKNYPPSGVHNGKKEVTDFFNYFGKLLEQISFEPKNFYSDGENVFVTGFYEFKVKANGNLISSDWIEVFTFENGKIKQYEEYTDTAAFQNAFEK